MQGLLAGARLILRADQWGKSAYSTPNKYLALSLTQDKKAPRRLCISRPDDVIV